MRQRFENLEYIWMDDPSCMWDYLNEKPTLLRLKSPNLNKHLSLCFWCIGIHRTCKAHTTVGGVLFISWCTFWHRKRVILAHFIFIIIINTCDDKSPFSPFHHRFAHLPTKRDQRLVERDFFQSFLFTIYLVFEM